MDTNTCLTINVNADNGDEFWMQLHCGMINFRHQDSMEKDEILGTIIDAFPVPDDADLDPGVSMAFEITSFSADQLNQLIDQLIEKYFEATTADTISITSEEL